MIRKHLFCALLVLVVSLSCGTTQARSVPHGRHLLQNETNSQNSTTDSSSVANSTTSSSLVSRLLAEPSPSAYGLFQPSPRQIIDLPIANNTQPVAAAPAPAPPADGTNSTDGGVVVNNQPSQQPIWTPPPQPDAAQAPTTPPVQQINTTIPIVNPTPQQFNGSTTPVQPPPADQQSSFPPAVQTPTSQPSSSGSETLSASAPAPATTESSSSNTGMIVGIAIGVAAAVGVFLLAAGLWMCRRRHLKAKADAKGLTTGGFAANGQRRSQPDASEQEMPVINVVGGTVPALGAPPSSRRLMSARQAQDGSTANPLSATPYATHVIDRPTTPLSADVDTADEDKGALQDSMVEKPAEDTVSSGGSSPHSSEQGTEAQQGAQPRRPGA